MLIEVPRTRRGRITIMSAEKATVQVGAQNISIETGKMAKQADGAVTVQLGETIVLVAAVAATKRNPARSFFPLTVDYREKSRRRREIPRESYFKREEPSHRKRNSHPPASPTALFVPSFSQGVV